MKRKTLLVLASMIVGCSSTPGGVVQSEVKDDLGVANDLALADQVSGADLAVLDVRAVADELDFGPGPDEQEEPLCDAGDGCFLDPCGENGDCQSGFCVEHMGENVCTIQCNEECPPGWGCQQIGSGPDLTFACVSKVANLCKPCRLGAECKSPGGAADVCLTYGDEGSFCGATCSSDDDCPWGFSCGEATTVDGFQTQQCLADAGVCPCAAKSVALGLWTSCESANEFGTCTGKRVCTEEGLSECDAAVAALESCNGQDDNCDGALDLDVNSGQSGDDMCEDGNPCTVDSCAGSDGCQHEVLDQGECLDGDACTIGDHCEQGVCVGMPIVCDDQDPCTDDFCDGLGGCSHEFNEKTCDDGDPCTVADRCDAGSCVGVAVPCDCQETSDCGALEDGDWCNGVLYCDTSEWPYECKVSQETVVNCPPPAGLDAPCLAPACDPLTGGCSLVPANDGVACDDGDLCTLGDHCLAGTCAGGPAPICKDDNPCTDDACDPNVGCHFAPNTLPCNDNDVCTAADQCDGGVCVGGAPLVCDDGNLCNGVESCDEQTGCQVGEPLLCQDADLCNGQETCDPATGCVAGKPLDCNDGNPCTDDTCSADAGCVFTHNQAACDDGNKCTLGDLCQGGFCVAAGLLSCDDDNPCTTDSCDPKSGCLHLLNSAPCNDGNVCTLNDTCTLGECQGQGALTCNDGNPCTFDSCDGESGCQFSPVDEACDDGNACTEEDQCINGFCTGISSLQCDDGKPCTKDFCAPESGCQFENIEGPCTDGDACTLSDSCVDGECVSGIPVVCDDSNECTANECDSLTGCTFTPQDGPCDDLSACTEGDVCADGKCSGIPVTCDDDDACTQDSCDADSGCLHVVVVPCCGNGELEDGEICDDGNRVDGDGCEGDCKTPTPLKVTFTTCGTTGPTGPSQGACDGAYADKPGLAGKVSLSSGIQLWTVPYTGVYQITAAGAVTLGGSAAGGYGAVIRGDVTLAAGSQLKILVGQTGTDEQGAGYQGGSGGSFVATAANEPLVVAGGGGGHDTRYALCAGVHGQSGTNAMAPCFCTSTSGAAGTNGNAGESYSGGGGGGGFYTSATEQGGIAFVNGGGGGLGTYGNGGFGGGGGTGDDQGGSGGGYSGGGGCGDDGHGGGGGSFNVGANPSNQTGGNSGQGYVVIEFLS
jgi:hypothetical protein